MKLQVSALSCVAALVISGAAPLLAGSDVMTWKIDGVERRAIVVSPRKNPSGPSPLILAFHGAGDTMDNFAGVDFEDAWPEAVVVYPQGLPRDDSQRPEVYGGVWQNEIGALGDRDLKLFNQMLPSLRKRFSIDSSRIYATGFSNGAKFTYVLWAAHPEVFAALGPVAGFHAPSLKIDRPVPLIHVAGERDRQNDYRLQVESIEMAREVNHASTAGKSCGNLCTEYGPTASGAAVRTIIHGGGHVYPTRTTEAIVAFFRQHRLARSR